MTGDDAARPAPRDAAAAADDPSVVPAPGAAVERSSAPASLIPDAELIALEQGHHSGPHGVLGQHPGAQGELTFRARRPLAQSVTIVRDDGLRVPLRHIGHGIWEATIQAEVTDYEIETLYSDGTPHLEDDPYRFLPTLGDVDIYLFGEGRHERLWEVLGAHVREQWGTHRAVAGTAFSVWAPHARAVRVIGAFNDWDGARHQLRRLNELGLWELFIPGVGANASYKFQILTPDNQWIDKADPLARHTEHPPQTASVVEATSSYEWQDDAWMQQRADELPYDRPMSIYELHAMSWRPGLSYRELAEPLIAYLDQTGFTHVEFMPLAEHPFGGSWGYQVTSYYAPTSRLGSPDDLRYLIDRLHGAGYGVIVDWVPGHFPKDAFALGRFDGRAVYEHPDPRLGEQAEWGTYVFNFGDSQVRNFLVANALFWFDQFHIDGLRVDAVASMIYRDYSRTDWLPNADGGREYYEAIHFLQETNATAYKLYPGIVMIAEESTSFPGVTRPTDANGLGFGLKWNMGWMNDDLRYAELDPIYRHYHHGELTFSFVYAWSEQYILPISHDEVVHGKGSMFTKMPGDDWQKLANLRLFYGYQWAHPGKQLLFMGQEFGQPSEWNVDRGLDWWLLDNPMFAQVQTWVSDLNRLYRALPPLWERDNDPQGLQWINGGDADNSVLAFLRRDSSGNEVACIVNFSNQRIDDYRIGLPLGGRWTEALNSDAPRYGGSGAVNAEGVVADGGPRDGFAQSAAITLPPLGALFLLPDGVAVPELAPAPASRD